MAVPGSTGIAGCDVVPLQARRDERGTFFELSRPSEPLAFAAQQWNAFASVAGAVRGMHVHADYDEFYALPQGRVIAGFFDVRRDSPTFMRSCQFEWSQHEAKAIVSPRGVAHAIYALSDCVMVFGLSQTWSEALDVLGCQWDDPALGFDWSGRRAVRSPRDEAAGTAMQMIADYEAMARRLEASTRRAGAA